ncbi:hypothetical protein PHLGIDRAFT_235501 [Phlebiopsis gigantea 11061_1 CR5-6]|uniref:Uncharacterized protein n=1 Tax=Phlebiopsis gigantea (strain 11061_1 CR5-6) TaxID=745531 RepID=A0A0C3NFM6_PHLG1|nr:hypothetical protein PHLGIDRAFT_235501 [Phlebiopsis gigantea 11061_1 CR5-6]
MGRKAYRCATRDPRAHRARAATAQPPAPSPDDDVVASVAGRRATWEKDPRRMIFASKKAPLAVGVDEPLWRVISAASQAGASWELSESRACLDKAPARLAAAAGVPGATYGGGSRRRRRTPCSRLAARSLAPRGGAGPCCSRAALYSCGVG